MLGYSLFGALLASVTGAAPHEIIGEVHFRFDSSSLPSNVAASLEDAVAFANTHTNALIVLDAHCDPIGTSAYNAGLATRRAESVRDRLISMGVSRDQVVLAIFGEDGERRATFAEDRRVTLRPTRDSLAAVIEKTFAGDGTAVTWGRPLTIAQIEAPPVPVPVASR